MAHINNKKDLHRFISVEKNKYFGDDAHIIKRMILRDHDYLIWRYQKTLRILEYHYNCRHKFRTMYWSRKHSLIGAQLGIHIPQNTCDIGLRIWHYGSIIVNGHAVVGKNCVLHGCNCIGNKGCNSTEAPVLGDNVDVGVGAVIIGNVTISDGTKIGANAVVVKDCQEAYSVLVGNPAKNINDVE